MLHKNCPWCGYNYKEVPPLSHSGTHLKLGIYLISKIRCGHCGNVSFKDLSFRKDKPLTPAMSVLVILLIASYFLIRNKGPFYAENTGILLMAIFLLLAVVFFIHHTQPLFRLEAMDGKAHDFYELDVSIDWKKPGEQNRIPFRSLRIRAGEVFVIDNATVTEGDIKPFVIIHNFHKFTGMTRAKIRVPVEVSVEDSFNLLVGGNAVAACRVEG